MKILNIFLSTILKGITSRFVCEQFKQFPLHFFTFLLNKFNLLDVLTYYQEENIYKGHIYKYQHDCAWIPKLHPKSFHN